MKPSVTDQLLAAAVVFVVITEERVEVGSWKLRLSTLAVIAVATLASLVGMAHFDAPDSGYLIASGAGVIFGLLVWRTTWQTTEKSG